MPTLLEKAKAVKVVRGPHRNTVSLEEVELALGYLNSEIGEKQMLTALDTKRGSTNSAYQIGRILIVAHRNGLIEIKVKS